MTADALLQDRRVLIVEDEYVVAEAMERSLRRAGAIVLGPVPSVAQALALIDREGRIDSAVLDINLGGQKVYPLLDRLLAKGIRCVFATGNDPADVPTAYDHVTRLEKPVDPRHVARALADPAPPPPSPAGGGADRTTLRQLRVQLLAQVDIADTLEQTLLAARLCEAIDAVDAALGS